MYAIRSYYVEAARVARSVGLQLNAGHDLSDPEGVLVITSYSIHYTKLYDDLCVSQSSTLIPLRSACDCQPH